MESGERDHSSPLAGNSSPRAVCAEAEAVREWQTLSVRECSFLSRHDSRRPDRTSIRTTLFEREGSRFVTFDSAAMLLARSMDKVFLKFSS
jgi:hypothetical protein